MYVGPLDVESSVEGNKLVLMANSLLLKTISRKSESSIYVFANETLMLKRLLR